MCVRFKESGDGERADDITLVNGLSNDVVGVGVLGVRVVATVVELTPDLLIEVDDGSLGSV